MSRDMVDEANLEIFVLEELTIKVVSLCGKKMLKAD
jgi:hypothetical protein